MRKTRKIIFFKYQRFEEVSKNILFKISMFRGSLQKYFLYNAGFVTVSKNILKKKKGFVVVNKTISFKNPGLERRKKLIKMSKFSPKKYL